LGARQSLSTKKATIIATIAFFAATKLEKKMTTYCFLLIFKHRKEGDGRSYHRLLCCNKTMQESNKKNEKKGGSLP